MKYLLITLALLKKFVYAQPCDISTITDPYPTYPVNSVDQCPCNGYVILTGALFDDDSSLITVSGT